MNWKHNTPSGWAWLLFAGASVLIACFTTLPKLVAGLMLDPKWSLVLTLLDLLSVAGLWQYAVRWRSPRTTRFWRVLAPIIAIAFTAMIARGYPALAKVLALLDDAPLQMLGVFAGLGLVLVPTAFTVLAVLRLGDYLGPTRRPLGEKPAQLSLSFS